MGRRFPLLLLALGAAARAAAQEPMLVVQRQPAVPVVALRVSLVADDPPGYAGAGHLLQHLHEPVLRERLRRFGGELLYERNADAVVTTLIGPAAELPALAEVVRTLLSPPAADRIALVRTVRTLRKEALAEWEVAQARVRAELRNRLLPAQLPTAGRPSQLERFEAIDPAALWAGLYRPDRVAIVAVGDVTLEALAQALGSLPAPPVAELPPAGPDTVPVPAAADVQATRAWFGWGIRADDAGPATLAVLGRLLHQGLRRRLPPEASVEVDHWWTHHGMALVAVVAAPDSLAARVRWVLADPWAVVPAQPNEATVRAAATRLRRQILFAARRPETMAEFLGRFVDRGSDPEAAQRFYDALARVDAAAVARVRARLRAEPSARVEIPPQTLPRRSP
jgi:predicted Zn-dependent peptidase